MALSLLFAAVALAGRNTDEIQFTLSKTHSIMVPVRVNDRAALFLLDTGADDTYIDTSAIDAHFQSDGEANVFTPTGRVVQHVYLANLLVGSRDLRMHVIGIDLSQMRKGCGCKAAGILGMTALRQFSSLEIDFQKNELRLKNSQGG